MMSGSNATLPGRPAKRGSVLVVENKKTGVASASQHAFPPGPADASSAAERNQAGERYRGSKKYDPKLLEEMLRKHAGSNREKMHSVKDSLESCLGNIKSQVDRLYTHQEEPQPASPEPEECEPKQEMITMRTKKQIDFEDGEEEKPRTKKRPVMPVIKGRPRRLVKISSPRDSDEESEEDEDTTALQSGVEEHYNVNNTAQDAMEIEDGDDDEELDLLFTADDDVENYNIQTSTRHVQELLAEFKTEKRTTILEELQSFYNSRNEDTEAVAADLEQKEEEMEDERQGAEAVKRELISNLDEGDSKAYRMLKEYFNKIQNVTLPQDAKEASAIQQAEKKRLKQFREELLLAGGNMEDKFVQNPSDFLEVAAIMQDESKNMENKLKMETMRFQAYEHANKVLCGALETGSDAPMEDYVTAQVIREVRKWALDGGMPENFEQGQEQDAAYVKVQTAKLKLEYEDLRRRLKREDDSGGKTKPSRSRTRRNAHSLHGTKFFGEEKITGDIFWQPSGWLNVLLIDEEVQEQYKKEIDVVTQSNKEFEHYVDEFDGISRFAAMQSPDYEESIRRVQDVLKSSKVKVEKEIGRLPVELSPEEQDVEDLKDINAEMDRLKEETHQQRMEELQKQEEDLTLAIQKEKQLLQVAQDNVKKEEKPLQAMRNEINMLRGSMPGLDFATDLKDIKASDTEKLIEYAMEREENFERIWESVKKAAERSAESIKAPSSGRTKLVRSGTKALTISRAQGKKKDEATQDAPPGLIRAQSQGEDEVGGNLGEGDEPVKSSDPPVQEEEPLLDHRYALRGVMPREKSASPSREASSRASRLTTPAKAEPAAARARLRSGSDQDSDPSQETYARQMEKANNLFAKWRNVQNLVSEGELQATINRKAPAGETSAKSRAAPRGSTKPQQLSKLDDEGGEATAELKQAMSATIKTARSSTVVRRRKSPAEPTEIVQASEAAVAKMATRSSKLSSKP